MFVLNHKSPAALPDMNLTSASIDAYPPKENQTNIFVFLTKTTAMIRSISPRSNCCCFGILWRKFEITSNQNSESSRRQNSEIFPFLKRQKPK
jgi:hypothetical protein